MASWIRQGQLCAWISDGWLAFSRKDVFLFLVLPFQVLYRGHSYPSRFLESPVGSPVQLQMSLFIFCFSSTRWLSCLVNLLINLLAMIPLLVLIISGGSVHPWNTFPQNPNFNSVVWKKFEADLRGRLQKNFHKVSVDIYLPHSIWQHW